MHIILHIQSVALARLVDCVDFKFRVACSKQSLLLPGPMAQELELFPHQPYNRASATLCRTLLYIWFLGNITCLNLQKVQAHSDPPYFSDFFTHPSQTPSSPGRGWAAGSPPAPECAAAAAAAPPEHLIPPLRSSSSSSSWWS